MNMQRLQEVLEQDEGRRNKKYLDSEGHSTIGIGHLMANAVQPDAYELATGNEVAGPTVLPSNIGVISDEAVNAIFNDDLTEAIEIAERWVIGNGSPSRWYTLSAVRKEIIVNMAFNLGPYKLSGFVKTRAAIVTGDFDTAAAEMMDSRWATQVGNRAIRLSTAMRSNDPNNLYDS